MTRSRRLAVSRGVTALLLPMVLEVLELAGEQKKKMKTFVATFLAILAAAAVIFTALWAKQRIDQWELAKNMCYAQVETEMKMMQLRTTRDQSEMRAMAQSAMDSHDVLGVAQRAVASLDAIKESRGNTVEIERKLLAILGARPFGLPLTAQEKKDLETAKRDIAEMQVEADQKLNQTWAAVLRVYQARADLSLNLVNTVAGLANFDQSMFVEVTNVRTSVGGAQMQLDPNKAPTDAAQLEQFEYAQGQLSSALSRLLLIVQRYPEWGASQFLLSLQAQLEGIENRISVEGGNFNTAVESYNSTLPSGSKLRPKLTRAGN
jgi:hypothetical protein